MKISVAHFLLSSVGSVPKLADGTDVNLHSVVATWMQVESSWVSDTWCRRWILKGAFGTDSGLGR